MTAPHARLPVRVAGAPLDAAQAAAILLHGRGAAAADILFTCAPLVRPEVAFLAPEASGDSWYPKPFTAPLESNEPDLSSALEVVDGQVQAAASAGIPPERVMLLGFSQGACLVLEYAARHARRYGAVVGLSGALIGPAGAPRRDRGNLAGTPVLLAASETDPYVEAERIQDSAAVLRALGGEVATHLYAGLGHEVSAEELALVRELMAALLRRDGITGAAPAPEGGMRR